MQVVSELRDWGDETWIERESVEWFVRSFASSGPFQRLPYVMFGNLPVLIGRMAAELGFWRLRIFSTGKPQWQ